MSDLLHTPGEWIFTAKLETFTTKQEIEAGARFWQALVRREHKCRCPVTPENGSTPIETMHHDTECRFAGVAALAEAKL